MRNPGRVLAASTLVFEAMVVFFAGLVAKDLTDLSTTQAVGGASAIAIVLVVVAGLQGRPIGRPVGWAMQAVVLACAYWVPSMIVIGIVFVVLWAAGWILSDKIAKDRATWGYLQNEQDPENPVQDPHDPQNSSSDSNYPSNEGTN